MNEDKIVVKFDIVGKFVVDIVKLLGISVLEKIKLLVVEIDGIGKDYFLLCEKLLFVFVMVIVKLIGYVL